MAYSTSNPPILVNNGGIGATAGRRQWHYASVDAATLVRVAGYFTNGYDLGMRAGDTVTVVDTDTSYTTTLHTVNAASTTSVDLTDGLAIGTTDTD